MKILFLSALLLSTPAIAQNFEISVSGGVSINGVPNYLNTSRGFQIGDQKLIETGGLNPCFQIGARKLYSNGLTVGISIRANQFSIRYNDVDEVHHTDINGQDSSYYALNGDQYTYHFGGMSFSILPEIGYNFFSYSKNFNLLAAFTPGILILNSSFNNPIPDNMPGWGIVLGATIAPTYKISKNLNVFASINPTYNFVRKPEMALDTDKPYSFYSLPMMVGLSYRF